MAERKLPEQEIFPGNSDRSKEKQIAKSAEPKREKAIKGEVTIKKKSLGRKLVDTFIGGTVDDALNYIVYDVAIPKGKEILLDAIRGGAETLIQGKKPTRHLVNDGGRVYTDYNGYSRSPTIVRENRSAVTVNNPNRRPISKLTNNDIIFQSSGEAESVLDIMIDILEDQGSVSLADLYDLVGIKRSVTDENWGWTNLALATVDRIREGYSLNLPRPQYLN